MSREEHFGERGPLWHRRDVRVGGSREGLFFDGVRFVARDDIRSSGIVATRRGATCLSVVAKWRTHVVAFVDPSHAELVLVLSSCPTAARGDLGSSSATRTRFSACCRC